MLKLLARTILTLLANAIGILAAAALLDGFEVDTISFVVAVVIFTVSTAVLGPFIVKLAINNANYLMGGIALVVTLVGLWITTLFSAGITIDGFSTWILATLIVWVFSVIGNVVLPLFIFKEVVKGVQENREAN